MTIIPNHFTSASEGAIASYDWTDFVAKAGYKSYFPCQATLSGSTLNYLTPTAMDSRAPYTQYTAAAALALLGELNFDLTFNNPAIIAAAPALINFIFSISQDGSTFHEITIYHVSAAAVETSLGTAMTPMRTATGGTQSFRESVSITLTEKKFKAGEKLRVSISTYGLGNLEQTTLWHDPSTRSTATDDYGLTSGTDFEVQVPFRIDI